MRYDRGAGHSLPLKHGISSLALAKLKRQIILYGIILESVAHLKLMS